MFFWARHFFIALIAILGVSQMIAACGQKGPLFLSEEKADPRETPKEPPKETSAPASAIPGPVTLPPPR